MTYSIRLTTSLVALVVVCCLAGGAFAAESSPHHGYAPCDQRVLQSSGYVDIPGRDGGKKHYFYWLFAPRHWPTNVTTPPPVVLWMTGGPGCSSGIALLLENGPCLMNEATGKLYHNRYGWNDDAYLLFVDQPTGVGYSYGAEIDYDHNESEVAEDMFQFLHGLGSKVSYPRITGDAADGANPFFIVGESYGGHYVPAVAHRILQAQEQKQGKPIHLIGIGVGNGLTDPYTQYPAYIDYATDFCTDAIGQPCIGERGIASMKTLLPGCLQAIASCNSYPTDESYDCISANFFCHTYTSYFSASGLNVYDIRRPCEGSLCYPMTHTEGFFTNASIMNALGANPSAKWEQCSGAVGERFQRDFFRNFNYTIPRLLGAGVRVLIYAGDMDWICNWMGNERWTLALDWPGAAGFSAAPNVEFAVSGRWAGKERTYGNFSFLRIYKAGHMVPMDQPEVSLFMLQQFLRGKTMLEA